MTTKRVKVGGWLHVVRILFGVFSQVLPTLIGEFGVFSVFVVIVIARLTVFLIVFRVRRGHRHRHSHRHRDRQCSSPRGCKSFCAGGSGRCSDRFRDEITHFVRFVVQRELVHAEQIKQFQSLSIAQCEVGTRQ